MTEFSSARVADIVVFMPSQAPTPTALTRAEHGGAAVHLSTAERAVLAEALRRGEDLREELEAKVLGYGRWLLSSVFDDDASAALDGKSQNPVWTELVRRGGGPTLRISRTLLYVAVKIAAFDKRITDQAWRGLDSGRKERLLPLGDAAAVRKAAQHVSRFDLSQAKTREYVTELMAERGKARQVRATPATLGTRARRVTDILGKPAQVRRMAQLLEKLPPKEREAVVGEVKRLREVLGEAIRVMEGR